MIDITFQLNGVSYSNLLSTYKVTNDIEVSDSITALDGTEHYAVRNRPSLTISFIPLNDAQIAELYNLLSGITLEVRYFDPNINQERLIRMRVTSNLQSVFGLKSIDGNRYYKGGEIVFRAVSCL